MYIALKSTNESRAHYTPEPHGGGLNQWREIKEMTATRESRPLELILKFFMPLNPKGRVQHSSRWLSDAITEYPELHLLRHHNRFMALFPGSPGWAGARRNLLLDFQKKSSSGLHGAREDNKRQTHRQSGWVPLHPDQSATHLHLASHFYAGCPSCHNPPWLGTGTVPPWLGLLHLLHTAIICKYNS